MESIRIIVAGDLLPSVNNYELFEKGDANELFSEEICRLFADADFSIANLEGPLTDSECPQKKAGPAIKAPTKTVTGIKNLGLSAVALANNHVTDYLQQGVEDTVRVLELSEIKHVGIVAGGGNLSGGKKYLSLDEKGKKVCIYNVSETFFNQPDQDGLGANTYDEWIVCNEIKELKKSHDFLIVIYHGGAEYLPYPSPQTKTRFHRMADCGADFITAQHTHCIGCEEWYKGSYLLYGQGNFLFARQKKYPGLTKDGLVSEVCISDEGFKVKNHRIVPIIITTKGLGVDEYGQHEQSCVSDNWNSIKLNASLLFGSSYKKKLLRQTMIHEMFHYFQSAYDSRGCFRKAKFGNKTILRLMETGGVWIEKFMDDDKMYDYKWDSNFQAVMTAVLKEGAGENGGSEMQNAQAWGYGSALILEWFAKNNGDATILKLYEAWRDKGASSFENWIKNGETATGTKFFDRFDDFVSLLAEGKLIGGLENSGTGDRYPYTVAYFNINNRINITSDGTVNANSQVYQYGVSSARVQLFNYEKSTDNKDMKLTITQKGDGVITKSYLYNVSRRTVVPLNLVYSGKPLVISEESTLRDLLNKDNGYVLYLVTQCASNYNETESSEIEISMEEQDVSIIGSWDYTVDHESKGRYTRSFTWGFSYDGSYSYTEKVDSWANSNKTEWDWGWNTRYETGTYSISGNMLNLSPTKNTLWDENDMNHNNPMSGTTSAYSLKFSVSSDGKSLTIDDKTYKKQ